MDKNQLEPEIRRKLLEEGLNDYKRLELCFEAFFYEFRNLDKNILQLQRSELKKLVIVNRLTAYLNDMKKNNETTA